MKIIGFLLILALLVWSSINAYKLIKSIIAKKKREKNNDNKGV